MQHRLQQHHVGYDALAADDFETFFNDRRRHLLDLIAKAMGKEIAESAVPNLADDYDLEEEDPADELLDETM